jgi:hypothetical protein
MLPDTVQTEVVAEVKTTAKFEVEVALTANGATPKFTPLRELKVMVCDAAETVRLTGTLKGEFAAEESVMTTLPA